MRSATAAARERARGRDGGHLRGHGLRQRGLTCDERMVSICAKDSGGPYHYDVVRGLIAAAEKMGAPYNGGCLSALRQRREATLRAGYESATA